MLTKFTAKMKNSEYAQYSIRVKNREIVQVNLKQKEIPTAVHYPMPLHLQECFILSGYVKSDFPTVEIVSKEIMSIPMNSYLTIEEIEYTTLNLKSTI